MDYTTYLLQLLIHLLLTLPFASVHGLFKLWHTWLDNSDKHKHTLWLSWLQQARSYNSDMLTLTTLTYSLLKLWHACSHRSDMLTLTSLTMWLRWEQAGSVWSSFIGRGESGFAGSKLVAVDPASLVWVKLASPVEVDLASLGASW